MAHQEKTLPTLKADNLEVMQNYIRALDKDVYATGSISASTDPFTTKTNKYAEKGGVIIVGTGALHFKWSAAGTAADTNDPIWPVNTLPLFWAVEPDEAYLRIIPASGSQSYTVIEVGEEPAT